MERITPMDLESARFPVARKGYDRESVDTLIKTAAGEIESLSRELQAQRQKLESELKELESFRKKESILAEALLLAQKTADEVRSAAHKEAELIIEHAKVQANEIRRKAELEADETERRVEQRVRDKSNFEARFRAMLEEYLRSLEEPPATPAKEQEPAA
ncbi:MAG TPA: DivIVA domain-containing protein [Fimbriimonadaceae bacterium]|nr:DivIVA domain-containing protein [Fimbriimonadaceae bacterium]